MSLAVEQLSRPKRTLSDSIMRYLGRGVASEFIDLFNSVCNDYGRVSQRTVSRYLRMLVDEGLVTRRGVPGHYVYERATKTLST